MRPVMPLSFFLIVVFVFGLTPASNAAGNSPQELGTTESLIRQATFIFVGTVVRLSASTVPEVPVTDATAVVRVDDIIEGPGAPPDLKGQEITVQLSQPGSVKQGEQTTFFTRGWLFGDSMAVVEVGRASEAQGAQQVREQVSTTHQKMADEALQSEISSAEAIVVGTVASVKPASIRHLGSEHDPDWYEAEITVESVEKGHLPGHTVTLLFAHSDDVMWQSAPKFKQGQQGVWLLHRNQEKLPGVKDQYTVLKPLDFQSRDNLEHIKKEK